VISVNEAKMIRTVENRNLKEKEKRKTINQGDEGIKKKLLNHVGNISSIEIGVAPVSGPLKIPTQH
jgi:hypothetical protein